MSVRIRYEKTSEPGMLLSTRVYSSETGSYKVMLDTANLVCKVLNAESGDVATSGTAKTLASLKMLAKSSLSSLGVSFTTEGRKRA